LRLAQVLPPGYHLRCARRLSRQHGLLRQRTPRGDSARRTEGAEHWAAAQELLRQGRVVLDALEHQLLGFLFRLQVGKRQQRGLIVRNAPGNLIGLEQWRRRVKWTLLRIPQKETTQG
jgi:hypothetical protein